MFVKDIVKAAKSKMCFYILLFSLLMSPFCSFVDAATVNVRTNGKGAVIITTPNVSITPAAKNRADIQCTDTQYLSEPGQPQIPWKVVTLLLPPNADLTTVSYTVNEITLNLIEGKFDIEPAPLYATWDENGNSVLVIPEGHTIVDGYDVDIYTVNEYWPQQDAKISQKGELRQWKLAEVAVPLVRYNPVTGCLQEVVAADIDVTFERSAAAKKPHGLSRKNWKKHSGRVKKLAANFDLAAGAYETLASEISDNGSTVIGFSEGDTYDYPAAGIDSTGYVIITTDDIVNSSSKLGDFAAHKQSLGWNMQVLTESDWSGGTGTTAYTNIHTWLQNNYLTDDILYVLLIGTPYTDTGTVPMLMHDDGRGSAPTDFFYSSFTGDAYWEVAVGRIPYYGVISDLDDLLQKAINYDTESNIEWRQNALLSMGRLDDVTPMYECGEQMKSWILDPQSITSDRIYEQDFGVGPEYTYPATYMAALWGTNQYGLVFWSTHGSQWSAQYFIDIWNVWRLNDNYPSIVYQGSCLNGYPEDTTNLGYAILKNGGIATIASSRESFYTPEQTWYPSDWCQGGLGYRYLERICSSQESVGVAWSNARQADTYYPCRTRGTLYGDPSITPMMSYDPDDTTPPTPDPMEWSFLPHVSGDCSIAMQAATASDASGSEYYFECTSGGGHDSGWQDSSFYKDTGLTEAVTYTYTVTARDKSSNQNTTEASIPASCVVENMTGLVFWDFEDGTDDVPLSDMPDGGSTDTISDIIMHGYSATYGPSFSDETPPNSGLSIYCDGVQDGYTTDTSLNSWSPQVWTIEISFKIRAFNGNNYTLIGRDGSSSGTSLSDFYLQLLGGDSNRLRLKYYPVGGGTHWTLDSSFFALASRWYRLAVVSDGQTIDMYVDQLDGNGYQNVGTFDISAQSVADNALAQGGFNWTFGRGWYGSSYVDYIDGYLDNVRFTEAVLTPEEFLDATSPVFTSGPIRNIDAIELTVYDGNTLATCAYDPDCGTLTFSKDSGPEWLAVAPDGTLSGIPSDLDIGENVFTVRVTDEDNLYDTAIMTIDVANIYSGTQGMPDLAGLAAQWLETGCIDIPACNGADLSGDNNVDILDLDTLTSNWLADESLQLYLRFDETSGTTASDSSIYQRSGQLVNTPSWDPNGMINGALSFDGTDNYVEITGYKGITSTAGRTCMAWIKTTASQQGNILSWGNEQAGQKWMFRIESDGTLNVGIWGGYIHTVTTVNDGEWYHVAAVLADDGSPSVDEILLYIDGILQTDAAANTTQSIDTAALQDVIIGMFENAAVPTSYFEGLADDVRIYNRALTQPEIEDIASP